VFDDLRTLARTLETDERGEELLGEWQARLDRVRAEAEKQPAKPGVVCLEWFDPLMVAGNWVPELIEIAGGRDLLGSAGAHSPWIMWEEVRRVDPDVLILMPCGFDLERTLAEAAQLKKLPGWSGLRAVQAGWVFAVDGNSYYNRPGPRLIDSAEMVAAILWSGASPKSDQIGWHRIV
jgi:iron complex transport system substrate-binding protein